MNDTYFGASGCQVESGLGYLEPQRSKVLVEDPRAFRL